MLADSKVFFSICFSSILRVRYEGQPLSLFSYRSESQITKSVLIESRSRYANAGYRLCVTLEELR